MCTLLSGKPPQNGFWGGFFEFPQFVCFVHVSMVFIYVGVVLHSCVNLSKKYEKFKALFRVILGLYTEILAQLTDFC